MEAPTCIQKGERAVSRGNRRNTAAPILPEWNLKPPEPYTPYRDNNPGQPWYLPFLAHYAVHGGKALAAAAAGVTIRTVERHLSNDGAFADESDQALRYHQDLLEWEALNLGRQKHNILAYFDRLKAELPARHVERQMTAILSMNVGTRISQEAGRELLRRMLASITSETKRLIGAMPEKLHLLEEAPQTLDAQDDAPRIGESEGTILRHDPAGQPEDDPRDRAPQPLAGVFALALEAMLLGVHGPPSPTLSPKRRWLLRPALPLRPLYES